jgi:hypothetical protein
MEAPKACGCIWKAEKRTTEQATNELLIKGKIKVSKLYRDRNRPVGLFSSAGDFYVVDSNEPNNSERSHSIRGDGICCTDIILIY